MVNANTVLRRNFNQSKKARFYFVDFNRGKGGRIVGEHFVSPFRIFIGCFEKVFNQAFGINRKFFLSNGVNVTLAALNARLMFFIQLAFKFAAFGFLISVPCS